MVATAWFFPLGSKTVTDGSVKKYIMEIIKNAGKQQISEEHILEMGSA
jgi:hypothetical protein